MNNIIKQLEELTGLTPSELGKELSIRGNTSTVDSRKLIEWQEGKSLLPGWAERVATQWIIELWQNEREQCGASDLWKTDTKYSQILSFLTMADIADLMKKNKMANNNKPDIS